MSVAQVPSLSRAVSCTALMLSAGVWLAGCGAKESGPVRYELSGAVTFAGKPVAAGEITFAPDGSQGNIGPGSFALISDGRYATSRGKGIVGGPYLVTIIGYDHPPRGEGSEEITLPLFPTHQTTVALPKKDCTLDFAVPRLAR